MPPPFKFCERSQIRKIVQKQLELRRCSIPGVPVTFARLGLTRLSCEGWQHELA